MAFTYLTGNYENVEQLKKAYHKLALKWHPDLGGDNAVMQIINAEYSDIFDRLTGGRKSADFINDNDESNDGNRRNHWGYQEGETSDEFIRIMEELIKLSGIKIELCGCWLWITGDTFTNKEALKSLGCKWCRKKQAWSWHPSGKGTTRRHKTWSMDRIRATYGSDVLSDKRNQVARH